VFGRPTATGVWVSSTVPGVTETVVKATYDAGGTRLGGYTVNLTLPATVKLMTVNYYDDYRFRKIQTALPDTTKLKCVTLSGYGSAYPSDISPNARGLLTGTRTYQLGDPLKYTVSALYYDHRSRVVQSHTYNHMGGFEDEYFAYTFTGKVNQHQQVHSAPGKTTQTEVHTYSYDHAERLLSVTHKLNGAAAVTLAGYTYDEIGRILTKKLATETSTYNYNVRSWLTRINGTKFNQTLAYNTAINGITPSTPSYNGNISAMKWKAGDEATERGYKFSYDGLNRLTAAAYGEGASLTSNLNRFNEMVTEYDKMGNIKTLQRQGKLDSGYGMMDNLTYTYTGNRLTRVSDAAIPAITYANAFHFVDRANVANEYTYDANGNATKDLNKNITSITYNALNLPSVITFADGNTITYGYDAAGSKLSVAYKSGSTTTKTEYIGNKVYKNGTLSMILTEEGYATLSGSTPTYYYYLKDHQGNNRVVINQSGAVQQANHYYPFGGLFGEGLQASNQPYRYNGKELDRFQNLDLFDYGARHYDAALGKWLIPDPLAEKYYSISQYAYVANNPVRFIDPNGMMYGDYYDRNSKYLGNDGIDDGKVYQLKNNYRARFENTDINWGGTLSEKHYTELQAKSNDLGTVQDAFITGDAVSDKRIQSLHPAIRMQATDFIKEANTSSDATLIRVAQGFRTYAEQDAIYAEGRTTPGKIVTWVKGGFSNHNFGLAFDIVGITNGILDYNLDWNSLSTLGKSKGFEWGGDWKKNKDMPHFENMFGNSMKELRALPKDKKGLPILKP
jgi:RHS repeat-associated protein